MGSYEIRQSAARPPRSTGHAEHDGTCPKGKKRTQRSQKKDKKINARAWRNESKRRRNKSKRWRKDKDQTKEINSKWKDKARTRLRRSHSAIEPRLSMTINAQKKNLQDRDHRSTTGREKWRVYYTLTRVGADITTH